MSFDSRESLRRSYKPDRVRLLLVGESPPASGLFFYCANSGLYRATRDAFARVYGHDWSAWGGFLGFFKSLGCYLDDLCLKPVDAMSRSARRERRRLGVPALTERVREYAPLAIASVMRGIHECVTEAAAQGCGGSITVDSLPFPRQKHAPRYTRKLETRRYSSDSSMREC